MYRSWKLKSALLLWTLLLMFFLPQHIAASPSRNPGPEPFASLSQTSYICSRQMTALNPERCPQLSQGARAVQMEYIRARLPDPLPELPVEELEKPEDGVTQYTFAYVRTMPSATYKHPDEAAAGLAPVREFLAGSNWVSVLGKVEYNGELWYEINPNEFIHSDNLALAGPSRFAGVQLTEQPHYPFAWINRTVNPSVEPGEAGNEAITLYRYDLVTIFGQQQLGDETWYLIEPGQWVEQTYTSRVDVDPPPEGVGPGEKWIEVNTYEQTLAAYEGERMVFATLASTGRGAENWTPDGLTRIWAKLPTTPMSNKDTTPDNPEWYYLEDVEWTQYFNGAYALHAAYWHDSFSFPRSHGCVNLSSLDSKWLFDWTTPYTPDDVKIIYSDEGEGTWVWVHKTPPVPEETENKPDV